MQNEWMEPVLYQNIFTRILLSKSRSVLSKKAWSFTFKYAHETYVNVIQNIT